MASVHKRQTGWTVRWRDLKGGERRQAAPSKRVAVLLKGQIEESIALGREWEPRAAREAIDLRNVAAAWLKDRSRDLSPASVQRAAYNLDPFFRWLGETYQTYEPYVLTRRMLAEWHSDADGFEGRRRQESTRNKLARTVHQLWTWAYDEEIEGVPRPKTFKLRKPIGKPTVAPTWEQCDMAIEAANGWVRDLFTVMRYTGLRQGQANGLRVGDVMRQQGLLVVRPELGKSRAEKRGRVIPLSPHFLEWFDQHQTDDDHVVRLGTRKWRHVPAARMRKPWQRLDTDVVPEAVWRQRPCHAFRKAFVSAMERAGVRESLVEYYVGHDLGVRGIYLDPAAMDLTQVSGAVSRIARVHSVSTNVIPFRKQT